VCSGDETRLLRKHERTLVHHRGRLLRMHYSTREECLMSLPKRCVVAFIELDGDWSGTRAAAFNGSHLMVVCKDVFYRVEI
jgi:hypothetical protein